MPDTSITIGTIPKNSRHLVVVSIGEYKGHKLADVRVHVAQEARSTPTKQGVSLGIGHLDRLIELLQRAKDEALARGFL